MMISPAQADPAASGPDTLEKLFDKYKKDVFRYILASIRDYHAAEDITQEVFLNVYRFGGQYSGRAAVRTWIFSIARNAVAGYVRKAGPVTPYSPGDLPEQSAAPEQEESFQDIIAPLDKDSRDVVSMRLIGGLKHREIAGILGETEAAVKKRYSRALKTLREQMNAM